MRFLSLAHSQVLSLRLSCIDWLFIFMIGILSKVVLFQLFTWFARRVLLKRVLTPLRIKLAHALNLIETLLQMRELREFSIAHFAH